MKTLKHFFAAPVLAVLVTVSLLSLTVGVAAPAQAQTRGGTLRLIVQPEPPILIPALNQQGPTQYVAGKIYESLLTYSFDLKPQPGLAKSWTVSEDGLTYTFNLQAGVTWHDGQPFTADDVVFSITEMLPATHARARAVLERFLKSAEALDEHTVAIHLRAPFPAFLLMFEPSTLPMMPRHVYAGTDYAKNPANQTPIGTGPFKFKEWRRGEHITLTRHEHYWQAGKPYVDTVIFTVIPDSASRAVAFERGNVDVLRGGDVDNVDVKRLAALPGVQSTTQGWELFAPQAYLLFNMHKPPFDNVKVRQAVMAATNRSLIVKNILFGFGTVATGPLAKSVLYYDANARAFDFNMKQARQLLKESGINPRDYTIQYLINPYGPTRERMDEYARQVLESLGFTVNAVASDAGGWATRISQWDFDMTSMVIYQYGDPALGAERLYVASNIVKTTPFANVQGYRNPQADQLWEAASMELDPTRRQALYSQIQHMLVQDVANGFLVDMQYPTLWHGKVKNLVQTAIGLNDTLADVYLEP